jgi:hypothetical protein
VHEWPNGRSTAVVVSRRITEWKAAALAILYASAGRSAAMVKISNDRRSGERRSAGLEWRTSCGEKGGRCTIRVLDLAERKRHRQLWRLRQQRCRVQMDCCADRTIVVCITDRMLRRRRSAGLRSGGGDSRSALDVAEMNVSERQNDLHRQRKQRQVHPNPQLRPQPPHHTLPMLLRHPDSLRHHCRDAKKDFRQTVRVESAYQCQFKGRSAPVGKPVAYPRASWKPPA